jgi:hypothetical protein
MADLKFLYRALNRRAIANLNDITITTEIAQLASEALAVLRTHQVIHLQSGIPDKDYFVFKKEGGGYSRPINTNLFMLDIPADRMQQYINFQWNEMDANTIQKLLYTIGISYCAAIDALGGGDRKTPSIFFEIFIANIFAREFNVNPATQVQVDIAGQPTSLPTDFLFAPNNQFVNFHVPVKLSTRERSVQAWAHQRVLEGIHGVGRYKGILTVMAETNFQKESLSVVEVCLPDQWRLYQMYISRMTRVYYFDMPKKYEELNDKFPHIKVKPFSDFFVEKAQLIADANP